MSLFAQELRTPQPVSVKRLEKAWALLAAAGDGGIRWDKAPCRFCGTGCHVQVGVKDGKVVAVPVKRGISDDNYTEITEGLEENQEVISGGYKAIKPFDPTVPMLYVFGKRKPDPSVYFEAARKAGVDPSRCAYVGDNLKRDVTGTRAAWFPATRAARLEPAEVIRYG